MTTLTLSDFFACPVERDQCEVRVIVDYDEQGRPIPIRVPNGHAMTDVECREDAYDWYRQLPGKLHPHGAPR